MRTALVVAALVALLGGLLGLVVVAAGGEFIPSEEATAVGDGVTDADRERLEALTGLTLPAGAVLRASHVTSALDASLQAVVTASAAEADAFRAQPALGGAVWTPTTAVPTLASALDAWPGWPSIGPTVPGLRTTLDPAPGRTLSVYVGETGPTTRILHLTWHTY